MKKVLSTLRIIVFSLVSDSATLFVAIRWVILITGIYCGYYVLHRGLDTTGITFVFLGLTLALVVATFIFGLVELKYQRHIQHRMYDEWAMKSHAPFLKTELLDDVQSRWYNYRILARRAKIKWRGLSIHRIVLRGEGGRINLRHIHELRDQLLSIARVKPHHELIVDLDKTRYGIFDAYTEDSDSPSAQRFRDHMRIVAILDETHVLNPDSPGIPTIHTQYDDDDRLIHVQATGIGVRESISEGRQEDLVALMNNKYAHSDPGKQWKMTDTTETLTVQRS